MAAELDLARETLVMPMDSRQQPRMINGYDQDDNPRSGAELGRDLYDRDDGSRHRPEAVERRLPSPRAFACPQPCASPFPPGIA